jgi:hypothetical protein
MDILVLAVFPVLSLAAPDRPSAYKGRMHGIVPADDALDKITPTAWKKRPPRVCR